MCVALRGVYGLGAFSLYDWNCMRYVFGAFFVEAWFVTLVCFSTLAFLSVLVFSMALLEYE